MYYLFCNNKILSTTFTIHKIQNNLDIFSDLFYMWQHNRKNFWCKWCHKMEMPRDWLHTLGIDHKFFHSLCLVGKFRQIFLGKYHNVWDSRLAWNNKTYEEVDLNLTILNNYYLLVYLRNYELIAGLWWWRCPSYLSRSINEYHTWKWQGVNKFDYPLANFTSNNWNHFKLVNVCTAYFYSKGSLKVTI